MESMRTVLANCLKEEANGYVISSLVKEFPTLTELMNADECELRKIKGIGAVKARQLIAILDFIRLAGTSDSGERVAIRSSYDVYMLMRSQLGFLQKEHFCVIGVNTKNYVVFQETISIGTLDATLVGMREVFKPLIRKACASCIVCHNHPSGDPTPSKEDIQLTKRLVEAGRLLGIPVLDHVVVGKGAYESFKEKGLL